MNYATALELPNSWAIDAQRYSYRAFRYSSFAFKAFSQEVAPVLGEALKDQSHYYYQCLKGANRWGMKALGITHNPLTSSIRAAHAELTSEKAIATYCRLQHIATESAMDVLVVGLCGVVAIASGIELAQKTYRLAKRVYHWVDNRLNPPLEQPTLLPTVEMCLAQLSNEELAIRIENLTDAPSPLEVVDEAKTPSPEVAPFQPVQAEDCPIWNPAPTDMHTEVQRMLEAIALDATAAPAIAEDMLVGCLDVPGATGTAKRQRKASTSKAGVKPKEARARTKV